MAGSIAMTNVAALNSAAAHLQARQLSSLAATCSYAPFPRNRKRVRDTVACRAAQLEAEEEPDPAEAPSDDEDLPDDILKLLGPRTVPTPVLSPEEVSAPALACSRLSDALESDECRVCGFRVLGSVCFDHVHIVFTGAGL